MKFTEIIRIKPHELTAFLAEGWRFMNYHCNLLEDGTRFNEGYTLVR